MVEGPKGMKDGSEAMREADILGMRIAQGGRQSFHKQESQVAYNFFDFEDSSLH